MRPLRALVIYIAAVFIGGALLAPSLYSLVQHFAPTFPKIAGAPFHRFLNRSFLIIALVGLWPLLRALGAVSLRETGIVAPHGQGKRFFTGLLLGIVSLAGVAGIALVCGGRNWVHTTGAREIIYAVFSAIGTAAVVGTLEEILFRGGIFGGLRRVLYWPGALVISSAIFALVHFLNKANVTGAVSWNSGLVLLPQMLAGFADFRAIVPGFFTLTLVGALLALAYQRTGNLYFSIGLHAGWVFVLRIYGKLTVQSPDGSIWFWGTSKMFDGWLAFLVIAALLLVFRFLTRAPKRMDYAPRL
jgi:membrane protease YdiL (CAAX protease family)